MQQPLKLRGYSYDDDSVPFVKKAVPRASGRRISGTAFSPWNRVRKQRHGSVLLIDD